MKKQICKLWALIVTLCFMFSFLAACGGSENGKKEKHKEEERKENSENEEDIPEIESNEQKEDVPVDVYLDLEDTIWYADGSEIIFYADGSAWMELDLGTYHIGSYKWTGESGNVIWGDSVVAMTIESEDIIIVENEDGDCVQMQYMGSAPEQMNLDLLNTSWVIEDVYYNFYDDGIMEIIDDDFSEFGDYEWDGVNGFIEIENVDARIYFRGDELYIEIENGYVCCLEYYGYAELE